MYNIIIIYMSFKQIWKATCTVLVVTWMSFCGFQSESYIMTVSAAVRLIPSPPARVHSRNTNLSESREREREREGGKGEREGKERGRRERSKNGLNNEPQTSIRTWFRKPVNGCLSQGASDLSINTLIEKPTTWHKSVIWHTCRQLIPFHA